jgi:hypothetical protein
VSIEDEVRMYEELTALLDAEIDFEPGPNDARIEELTQKLCSTPSGIKLLDWGLQAKLSAALDARGDVPEPGSKKALERKN